MNRNLRNFAFHEQVNVHRSRRRGRREPSACRELVENPCAVGVRWLHPRNPIGTTEEAPKPVEAEQIRRKKRDLEYTGLQPDSALKSPRRTHWSPMKRQVSTVAGRSRQASACGQPKRTLKGCEEEVQITKKIFLFSGFSMPMFCSLGTQSHARVEQTS